MVCALLTIPVNAATRARQDALAAAFGATLGASEIAIDAMAAKATLRFRFPGDLDPLMRALHRGGLSQSATVAISVHVESGAGATAGRTEILGRLGALPTVSNPAFDGRIISATIAAATAALNAFHDEILSLGLIPINAPAHKSA